MTTTLNTEVKAEWLKALRSGEYDQCRNQLRQVDPMSGKESFCCLGVLSEIHRKKFNGERQDIYNLDLEKPLYWNSRADLPDEVAEWAGLGGDNNPAVSFFRERDDAYPEDVKSTYDAQPTLAELNDDDNLTFPQIADIIEAQL